MKYFNKLKAGIFGLVASGVGAVAMATPTTDYDAIVAAVDWADVITGIAAIAALIAGVFVVRKGARMLLSFLR